MLSALAFGDVDHLRRGVPEQAVRIGAEGSGEKNVDDVAPLRYHLVLDVFGDSRPQELRQRDLPSVASRFVGKEVRGRSAEYLSPLITEHVEPVVVHADEATLIVDRVHHHRGAVVDLL